MIVAQVRFSLEPGQGSRTAPITARVQADARGGRPVSGEGRVFMRATPQCGRGPYADNGRDGPGQPSRSS